MSDLSPDRSDPATPGRDAPGPEAEVPPASGGPAPSVGEDGGEGQAAAGADPTGGGGGEWADTAVLPLEEVKELFVTLSKALRAFQLYDENNPVYRRFVSNVREAFQRVWNEGVDELRLTVDENRLLWDGTEVYKGENRNESLAFLLYKDGVRDVTFVPGIEEEELEPFLGVLQRARRQGKEGDDLLIILWEEDLRHFKYQYIDLLAEGVEMPVAGDGGSGDLQEILQAELDEAGVDEDEEEVAEAGEEAEKPSGMIDPEDFNPTLYSLDSRELATLEEELEKEMARDLRDEVLNALFDRVEEPENRERQSEILEIFRTLLPNFLSRGQVAAAGRVLAELEEMREEEDVFDQKRAAEVDQLLDDLSEPEALHELVQAIQDGSIRSSPQELGAFLRHLRTDALAPLLRAVEEMEVKELQPVLREAIRGIAERHPGAVPELLESDDPVVVVGAARLAGRMGLSDSGPTLARLLRHDSEKVRLAAVEAALDLKASTVMEGVQDLLTDESRQVRIAAARALGELRYRPAAERFRSVVTGKAVRQADLTEKIAFFESYGQVGDPKAVEILDGLLNGKGFLGKKESSEIRACAALALGMVGSPEAEAALRKARGEEDPVVRNAVSRALRGEGGER